MSPFPPLRMSNDAWGMNPTTGSSGGGSTSLYFNDTMRFGTVGDSVRCGTSWNSFIGKKRCYEHSLGQLVSSIGLLFQNVALSAIELPADEREKRTRTLVSALYDDSVWWAPTSTASVVVIYAWLQHWVINQAQGEFPGGITSIKVLILSRRRVLYALAESSEIGPRPGQS
eukprot:scaffold2928_cov95-Skeletonema_menzelii.AAC.1